MSEQPRVGWAVIEERDGDLDALSIEVFHNHEDAIRYADEANRDAEAASVPTGFGVWVLHEVPEGERWEWGLRGPGGKVMAYVHERAARAFHHGGVTLVRRRVGGDEWQEAPA